MTEYRTWVENGITYTERPMTGILSCMSEEQKERIFGRRKPALSEPQKPVQSVSD